MLENMDTMLLMAKFKWDAFVDRLMHEEKGAADIVAIMVVIVILLAVAVIFKEQLSTLVESVFTKANEWVENN